MINITLPDGSTRQAEKGVLVGDVVKSISEGLFRSAVCAKVNDQIVGLGEKIDGDCTFRVFTFNDQEGKEVYWHTASHILAHAVKRIFPTAKLAIGPAIRNGFYYDFEFKTTVTLDDFEKIEEEMKKIIKADFPIEKTVMTKKEAKELYENKKESYKMEIIDDITDMEVGFYTQGDFSDICRGPHLLSTGRVKAFKLTQLTGAYWKGSEKNKMLSRIYGTAFEKRKDLEEYLEKLEEAKKRDHNKLGRELGYFTTDENIGQGLPLLMPKGAKLFQILNRFVEDEEAKRGYVLTRTPVMAKSALYKISGHWDHYRDGMFVIGDTEKDEEVMALRPMTCPFQYTVYNNGLKSYRDLPIRYAETSSLFRNESSGEMHGLIRVRQFTISEGHIVCAPSQLEKEFADCLKLVHFMLDSLGFSDDVSYRFSKWDKNNTEKYINEPEKWEEVESLTEQILNKLGVKYSVGIDEAAFYGPKLDVQIRNVYGKEDTIITIQLDMFLARNFQMTFVNENNEKEHPYIIHRTSIGCYERTMALLIEKYAGALPVWMSPEQVRILSLTDRTAQNAIDLQEKLNALGIRTEVDNRSEKIGYKIREAQLEKVPYMFVLGDKEVESNVIAVRRRGEGDIGAMTFEAVTSRILEEVATKKLD